MNTFMRLNIELNENDLEELLKLYNKIEPLLQGRDMESIYELCCESCGAEYELAYIEQADSEQPIYCPFCGSDIDLTDVEEESADDEWLDDLDDIDKDEWKD
jgi:rRNA maturation endonuclease Nob1